MDYSRELLFFFSALGAFNGVLLSFYFLFFAKPKHIANFFLGAFLLALSIRVGKSVFFFFNPDLALGFLQFGLTACFFIGPSLYFYIKTVTNDANRLSTSWKYHYLVLLIVAGVVGYIYPFEGNIELWRCHFITYIYYEWVAYSIAAGFLLKEVFQNFLGHKDKNNSVEIWLISLWLGNLIIWAGYFFGNYMSYIVGALSFSFLFYIMALHLFFNKKKDYILFRKQAKYGAKKIEATEATQLLNQLKTVMVTEEMYKNPNLKLPDVAKKLNILSHRLSQLMNDNLGKSFNLYINEYRIQAAKEMLKTNDQFSLDGIGYECGFNSKSNFFATFKKVTGTTPAKYKKEHNSI